MQQFWFIAFCLMGIMLATGCSLALGAGLVTLVLWVFGAGETLMGIGGFVGACMGLAMLIAAIETGKI